MTATLATSDVGSLIPIAVNTLQPCASLRFDLYEQSSGDAARLLLARDHPLSQDDIDRLHKRHISTLYVSGDDTSSYSHFLIETVVNDEARPTAERWAVLREATKGLFDQAYRSGNVREIVSTTERYGDDLTNVIFNSDLLVCDLVGVMTHDYSTFTHATNVATYALMLAEEYGIADVEDLRRIGQGALLHDVGKTFISASIFQKKEKLEAEERKQIKEHPRKGFEALCHRDDLNWGQLMMVYQHHERLDGGGYPVGIVGAEIHLWARICAIADVFDALTRDRPYRGAVAPARVLEYLDRESGRGFDEELVQCWIKAISKTK